MLRVVEVLGAFMFDFDMFDFNQTIGTRRSP